MGLRKTFSNRLPNVLKNGLNPANVLSHLSYSDLKNFIRAHGVSASIKRAVLCPCVKEDTGQPSLNCGVCRGIGFAYITTMPDNLNCITTKILIGQRAQQKNWNRKGGYTKTGQTTATTFGYIPSIGDLIKPSVDIETINDEFHKRGDLYTNGKTSEFLLHDRIKEVEGIFGINANKTVLVEYRRDIDFKIDGRKIEWLQTGNPPALGERYIVRYQAIPDYIVISTEPSFYVEHDNDEPVNVREELDKPIVYDVNLTRIDKVFQGRHNEKSP